MSRASWRERTALAGLLVAGLAAGCSTADEVRTDPEPDTGAAPFDIATTQWRAAAAGSDLILVEAGERVPGKPRQVTARLADGSWETLPPVPFDGYVAVASTGPTVAVGGVACPDEACSTAKLAIAVLSSDRTAWRQLDVPDTDLSLEAELNAARSPQSVGYFSIGPKAYIVDAAGAVRVAPEFPPLDGVDGFLGCVTADTVIAVPFRGQSEEGANGATTRMALAGNVALLNLASEELAWDSGGPVPDGVVTRYGDLCLPQGVSIQSGPDAWSFDLSGRAWTIAPSNITELTGSEVSRTGLGETAVAPDQRTIFLVGQGRVLVRSEDGQWSDTGQPAAAVYSTSSSVLAFDPTVGAFVEIWSS
jgi:hypothetical protein